MAGRVSREQSPQDYDGLLEGMVVFENGYMMDEKGRFFGRIYREEVVKPIPTDDQKTGLVLSNIEMLYADLKMMTQGGVGVTYDHPRNVLEEIIPYAQNEQLIEVLNEVYSLFEDDEMTEEEKGELIQIMFDLDEAIDVADELKEEK